MEQKYIVKFSGLFHLFFEPKIKQTKLCRCFEMDVVFLQVFSHQVFKNLQQGNNVIALGWFVANQVECVFVCVQFLRFARVFERLSNHFKAWNHKKSPCMFLNRYMVAQKTLHNFPKSDIISNTPIWSMRCTCISRLPPDVFTRTLFENSEICWKEYWQTCSGEWILCNVSRMGFALSIVKCMVLMTYFTQLTLKTQLVLSQQILFSLRFSLRQFREHCWCVQLSWLQNTCNFAPFLRWKRVLIVFSHSNLWQELKML